MKQKQLAAAFFCLALCLFIPFGAYADIGPKPQIEIVVKNPPAEGYYLDLLVQNDRPYHHLNEEKRAACDEKMLGLLHSECKNG